MIRPDHIEILRDSAIPSDVAEEWGIKSVDGGLSFPWRNVESTDPAFTQLRWDNPDNGRKYDWPTGQAPILNFPLGETLNGQRPIVLVEGTKQHIAVWHALGRGGTHLVVGLMGCWGFSHNGRPIQDLADIKLAERSVYVIFDGDMAANQSVWDAAERLDNYLAALGAAKTAFVNVPGEVGIDDFLGSIGEEQRAPTTTRLLDAAGPLRKRPKARRIGPLDVARKIHQQNPIVADRVTGDVHQYRPDLGVYEHTQIEQLTASVMRNEHSRSFASSVLDVILSEARAEGWALSQEPQRLIVVRNGVLDPATGELSEHSPDIKALVRLDVDWSPNARHDRFDAWIERQAPGQRNVLLDAFSDLVDVPGSPERATLMVGEAATGKSTVQRLLERLIGREYTSAVELADLGNRFMAAELYGKLLNIGADLSSAFVNDLAIFKKLTGRDLIEAERKFGQPFTFQNRALMVFSSNTVPVVGGGETASYFRRVVPIQFENPFVPDGGTIEDGLIHQLPGFLRLLVEAYQERIRRGTRLGALPAVQARFETESDRVALFIETMTRPLLAGERLYRDGTTGEELHAEYVRWSDAERVPAMGRNKFYGRLRSLGVARDEGRDRRFGCVCSSLGNFSPLIQNGNDPSSFTQIHDNATKVAQSATCDSEILTQQGFSLGQLSDAEAPKVAQNGSDLPIAASHDDQTVRPASAFGSFGQFQDRKVAQDRIAGFADGPVAVDIETNAAFHHGDNLEVRSIQLSDGEDVVILTGELLGLAADVVSERQLVVWRASYEVPILSRLFRLDPDDLDVIDLAETSKTVAPQMSLKDLARAELGEDAGVPEDALGALFDANGWSRSGKQGAKPAEVDAWAASGRCGWAEVDVSDPVFLQYAGTDALITKRLFDRFHGEGMSDAAAREAKVARVLAGASTRGVAVDVERLSEWRETAEDAAYGAKDAFVWKYGVNPYSDAKVRLLLSDVVDLGSLPKTPGGEPSLKAANLRRFAGVPVIDDVIDARDAKTRKAKPAEILAYVTPAGRVHPDIAAQSAHTYRMASSKPALQNLAKSMRSVFIADKGRVFGSVDLSQIELRVAAAISGEFRMVDALASGADIHQATAESLGVDRRAAKAINFGVLYGMGAAGVAGRLAVSKGEAQEVLKRYSAAYPALWKWRAEVHSEAERVGYVVTPFGRRIKVKAAYTGINYLVQSAARDVFAEGVARLFDAGLARNFVIPIHDECLVTAGKYEIGEVLDQVRECLAPGVDWRPASPRGIPVPIEADVSGPAASWGEIYEEGNG